MNIFMQVSTKVTVKNLMPSAKAVISFRIPDHKSGKVSAYTPYEKTSTIEMSVNFYALES